MTETQAKRSGCLTAFIIIVIVLQALGAIGSFLAGPMVSAIVPEYAVNPTYSIISGVISLLSIVFLVGVWKFKKWGFYGYVVVSAINIVLSILMTGSILMPLISGLILPAILIS